MTQVDTTQEETYVEETNKSVALVPFQQKQEVEPMVGVAITPQMSFREKRAVNRAISKLIDGESETSKKYLNKVIWVSACAQHPVVVNTKQERINPLTGEVLSPYINKTRTVLHVVAVDNKLLDDVKRLSFTGISIERYFKLRFIDVYGFKPEEPLPYILTQNDNNSYNVSEPEQELFFSEVFPNASL